MCQKASGMLSHAWLREREKENLLGSGECLWEKRVSKKAHTINGFGQKVGGGALFCSIQSYCLIEPITTIVNTVFIALVPLPAHTN